MKIYPVLLAGGLGTRLWPLSRRSFPKQFSKFIDDESLFQKSVLRLTSSDKVEFLSPIVLSNSDNCFIVTEQLQEVGLSHAEILIEPEARNTAPAILAASLFAYSKDSDAILIAAPSDHLIPDVPEFHEAIALGLSEVHKGNMVAFGVKPSYPEIGFGYLELSAAVPLGTTVSRVLQFVEKPAQSVAEKMLKTQSYLWNTGIYLFKADDMIASFQTFAPEIFDSVSKALDFSVLDLGFLNLASEHWSMAQNVSVDYAIMEKIQNLVAVNCSFDWSDLGDWSAVWTVSGKDSKNNVVAGSSRAIDCEGSMLRSENVGQQLIGLGLSDVIAIAMPDAVLVAHRSKAQDVKKVADLLKMNKISQLETFALSHRPWGYFESLAQGSGFHVKRLCVNPGAALSLQSHRCRSEHWVIVEGVARVTIAEEIRLVNEGEYVYVPVGAIHRIENPGTKQLVLIEVQVGSYFGEDDIERYEDSYGRVTRK